MKKVFIFLSILGIAACGTDNLTFKDVASIPPGDGAGVALSGNFAVALEVTSDGCSRVAELDIPIKGDPISINVVVEQEEGSITFDKIRAKLRGAINFDNTFDVGGSEIFDVGESEDNAQRMVHVVGEYTDANQFEGSGNERIIGGIENETFDCTFSFDIISGIRQ